MTIETELPAVKVKALEWKGMVPTAETIVGAYSIGRIGGNWSVGLLRHGNSYEAQIASGEAPLFEIALVAAKAAAQADYERRIISALTLKDDPGNGEAVLVPVEPPEALLRSMAIRYDHGLAVPGYYDQPIFGAENVGHARRMESTLTTMRQLYEEVVGKGFYRAAIPQKEG